VSPKPLHPVPAQTTTRERDATLVILDVVGPAVPDTDRYRVTGGAGTAAGHDAIARRAVSCVVEPRAGDQVLATSTRDGPVILAILTRAAGTDASLSVPDAASVTLAADLLTLVADSKLVTRTAALELVAERASVDIGETSFLGRAVTIVTSTLRSIGEMVHHSARKLVTQATHSVRVIDDVETVSAGTIVVRAKETHSLQATQILISASGDIRVDGETVNFG
jgi:hypothetical protein